MALKLMSDETRFMLSWEERDGCWEWQKSLSRGGYGQFHVGSRKDGSRKTMKAHRFSYQTFVGPIKKEMVLDHMCRNRKCVNFKHLRMVTKRQNALENSVSLVVFNALKKRCKRGHKLFGDNLYSKNGKRFCVKCRKDQYLRTSGSNRIRRSVYLSLTTEEKRQYGLS